MSYRPPFMSRRTLVLVAAVLATARPGSHRTQQQEPTDVKIRLTFGHHTMTATLYDNPSARDFASCFHSISRSRASDRTRRSHTCHAN
ncbi:hypothetical protein JOH52_007001 [Sinorhizobium meliloti]|nr:hypothetical protein [Sinorhizobium meliloti]CCM70146.1 putative secreted protein [Sinorhizobium meliloti Rm41]